MDALAKVVREVQRLAAHRDRVAIGVDGPDAAGKSTFSDRLAESLDVAVVRACLDDFQRAREERYRRGRLSPQGYYRDAFDYAAARREVIDPFLSGAAKVRTGTFDYRSNAPIDGQVAEVPQCCVLIVDGVFLLRPELRGAWALSLYLHVSDEVSIRRGTTRDADCRDSNEVEQLYRERYLPGQALYRAAVNPRQLADIVLDNSDVHCPVVLKWRQAEELAP